MGGRLLLVLLIVPVAVAQGEDPGVRDEDFDTSPPPADESYIDDGSANATEEPASAPPREESGDEPALSDADFDTSAPNVDTSYLDAIDGGEDGAPPPPTTTEGAPPAATTSVPALGALPVVAAFLVAAALATRR